MSIPLRQSTASQELLLPRQVDATDGNTEEDALTINASDIKLWKNGAVTVVSKNSGGATFIANGLYVCTLDATDCDTLGGMLVLTHLSGARPTQIECIVYPANVYDSLFAGTDKLEVDTTQIAGSTTAATRQSNLLLYGISNSTTVAASPSPTTSAFAGGLTGSSHPNNCYRNSAIVWKTGANVNMTPRVTSSFTSASGLFTVSPALDFLPVAGDTFDIVGVSS